MNDEQRDAAYWRYIDDYADSYQPLMAALSEEFGTKFSMYHTGGGCMAIEAVFESGHYILITDAADILSSARERTPTTGYAVGVYEEDECGEAVGWASSPQAVTAGDVARLVRLAFENAKESGYAPVTEYGHVEGFTSEAEGAARK